MNVGSILVAGFAATIVLTTILEAGQGFGITRMSLPFLLGTILTPARDRAMVFGVGLHMAMGLVFALMYGLIFESLGHAGWQLGAAMGIVHACFVLTIGMAMIPGIHPHMVSEYYGPTPNRLLQPPGFLALNYGRRTPIVTFLAHVIYGAMLGAMYHMVP
jgi:hypothetical protein